MKIKQTTFYALLAIHRIYLEGRQIITSVELAEKENISHGVMIKTLRVLTHAGILHVHQGRGNVCGGYSLAKRIDEITLLDIIDIMEQVNICKNIATGNREREAQLFCKFSQINESLKEEFSKYTIQDLFVSGDEMT